MVFISWSNKLHLPGWQYLTILKFKSRVEIFKQRQIRQQVPRSALKLAVFETAVHDSNKKSEDSLFNPTLLILPLLMVLPGWATVLYIMAEVVGHSWSHHGESEHRPLATPMQLMFHHKCAECVARRQMQKVGHSLTHPCFYLKTSVVKLPYYTIFILAEILVCIQIL